MYAGSEDREFYTTYHAQVDRNCFLVTLGKLGMIVMINRRLSDFKTVQTMKICENVIPKVVNLHPIKSELFLAPIDKGCGIFDMRKQVSESIDP